MVFPTENPFSIWISCVIPGISSQFHKNRLGAVLEAAHRHIERRAQSGSPDMCSLVLFQSYPAVVFEYEPVDPARFLQCARSAQTRGGTNFEGALDAAREIFNRHGSAQYVPVLIFLSDGMCHVSGAHLRLVQQENDAGLVTSLSFDSTSIRFLSHICCCLGAGGHFSLQQFVLLLIPLGMRYFDPSPMLLRPAEDSSACHSTKWS